MPEGRVALVTGGAKGLGRASALRLAAGGQDIAVLDVLRDQGRAVAGEIARLGRRAAFIEADVSNAEAVEKAVAEVLDRFGRLDVLINSAGIIGRDSAGVLDTPISEWHQVFAVNVTGTYLCIRAALPSMAGRGWGRIVNFTSAARHGVPTLLPYAVSKAAIVAITAGVAKEYTRQGVLINAVQPSRAKTDMVLTRVPREEIENPAVPIGRLAEPEEIAEVVYFLASERNTYMSGAVVPVMGGSG